MNNYTKFIVHNTLRVISMNNWEKKLLKATTRYPDIKYYNYYSTENRETLAKCHEWFDD